MTRGRCESKLTAVSSLPIATKCDSKKEAERRRGERQREGGGYIPRLSFNGRVGGAAQGGGGRGCAHACACVCVCVCVCVPSLSVSVCMNRSLHVMAGT